MEFFNSVVVTTAPRATILVRLLVGAVFLSEGIQKFLFSQTLGVGRFTKIGILFPGDHSTFCRRNRNRWWHPVNLLAYAFSGSNPTPAHYSQDQSLTNIFKSPRCGTFSFW